MTEMPSPAGMQEAMQSPSRINGVLDVPRPNRVAGWAIDRSDPAAAVTVTIRRDGRPIAELRADTHRPDLEKGGIGTGRYGFSLALDPPLPPGMEFTITAEARTDDGTRAEIRPVGRARPSDDPARLLAERTYLDLGRLRSELAGSGSGSDAAAARLTAALDRVEVAQARIEAALAGLPGVPQGRFGGMLWTAVVFSLAMGAGSLALGLWSVFGD